MFHDWLSHRSEDGPIPPDHFARMPAEAQGALLKEFAAVFPVRCVHCEKPVRWPWLWCLLIVLAIPLLAGIVEVICK